MNVETLIYAYLAICTAMILFNCACIFVFRRRDRLLRQRSARLTEEIAGEIRLLQSGAPISEEHLIFLRKRLRKIGDLMAFDETLEELLGREPDAVWVYIDAIRPVFTWLAAENYYRGSMQMAYFAYVLGKYRILKGKTVPLLTELLMKLLEESSLYCRENALQAIYSTGDDQLVLRALRQVDESGRFHHAKLLTDGLLTFSGDRQRLVRVLWDSFDAFSVRMQTVILDYIRFGGGGMADELLLLLADEGRDDELRFSCIRYFGKYPDPGAYPLLLSFLEHPEKRRWEYAAISAASLSSYPGERTVLALKRAMSNASWYIRFNAARSLETFQLTYQDLGDVMDSGDRYAREILQYRLDVQQTQKERETQRGQEAVPV